MRLSKFFLPILKENPIEASIISHRMMIRAGMIRQITAGIYAWLPLGLMVLNNVSNIIRKHLNKIDCQEILMPCIQPAEFWQESGRFDDYGKEMLKIKDRHEHDLLYGPTCEEMMTYIFRTNSKSYKDLPKNIYQIHWKFRDEIRPRFGVMRGREFLMKDGYSFDLDFESAKKTYNQMYQSYFDIFKDMGVVAIPLRADSGAIGGDLSHEFHIIADTGESGIYYQKEFAELIEIGSKKQISLEEMQKLYAATDEKHNALNCPVAEENLYCKRGIEVGHIFYFGTKYSKSMNCQVMASGGSMIYPEMGSYGIGVSRVVAAIIEASHDENGIIWPYQVAPFKFIILNLKKGDQLCDQLSEEIYLALQNLGIETLYDDSEVSIGNKFANADLIGIPYQIIIGPKNAVNSEVELKTRHSDSRQILSFERLLNYIQENIQI